MTRNSLRDFIRQSRIRLVLLLCVGFALVTVGLLAWLWNPEPATHELRITGGVVGLNRHGVAQYLLRHSSEVGLDIEVVPSEGTVGATRMVQNGEVDMAIVNGLLHSPESTSVRQVSAITVEAIHLLVKQEYAEEVEDDFSELQRLSLNIGPEGSENEMISRALLAFCDVHIGNHGIEDGLQLTRQSIDELQATLEQLENAQVDQSGELRKELPDLVIHVSTLPSPLAKRLIQVGDYRLIHAPFAEAFSKITVEEEELDRDHLDQLHVVPFTIPAFMYGATPPIPETDCPTIGCPMILIVHEDVPSEVISRLLPRLFEGPVKRVYHPPPLRTVAPTYPWHEASIEYRDQDKPILRADIIDAIQRIFGMIAPLLGGCLALFGYYRWRQTLRFIEYFEKYQSLDRKAKGLTRGDVVTPAEAEEARRLEGQLTQLQEQAVADFCHNYFYGDGVFRNFIQLLAETRSFLRTSAQSAESTSLQKIGTEETSSTQEPRT